ncbi:MAG: porin family protein [Campylobacteraceae bacterium]|nr:porin family protein [Campylobacteraceae bacterium]
MRFLVRFLRQIAVLLRSLASTTLDVEVSSSYSSAKASDSGGTFELYGGYRMPNLQFGLSYANINCEDCDASYIMASGAYVYEGYDIFKPFIGLGLGLFNYEESGFLDENGFFGTVNIGANAEFEHFFVGLEFRQHIFGGVDEDIRYSGVNMNAKVEPSRTFLLNVGYKF